MKRLFPFILVLFLLVPAHAVQPSLYNTANGTIDLRSDAPQELIHARSVKLRGVIDTDKKTFAFAVTIRSFMGFNSELQREHFNDNYMESEKYKEATFTGKIVENIDLKTNGRYAVRAKGLLSIHGVEQERIIPADITVSDGTLQVTSGFIVLLSDHQIKIPKVVHQKIASIIDIKVTATLKKK